MIKELSAKYNNSNNNGFKKKQAIQRLITTNMTIA
jgi:hypothetical protein